MKLKHVVLPFFLLLASAFSRADGLQSTTFLKTGQALTTSLVGTGTTYHRLTWTKTGTVTVCSVRVDSSSDGVTWNVGDIIAAQDCSSNGASSNVNFIAAYARVNMTSFTGTGSVTVAYNLYNNIPASGSGLPAGLDTQVQFNDGGVFGGDTNLLWDKTLNKLTIGPGGIPNTILVVGRPSSPQPALLTAYGTSGDFSTTPNLVSMVAVSNDGDNDGSIQALQAQSIILAGAPGFQDVAGGNFSAVAQGDAANIYSVISDASISGGSAANNAYGLLTGAGTSGAGTTLTNAYAVNATTSALTGSVITTAYGVKAKVLTTTTGSATSIGDAYALHASITKAGGATINNAIGLEIENITAGSVSNYALHIADQGTGANDYAIKIDGGNSNLGPDTTTLGKLAKLTNYNATTLTGDGIPYIVAKDDKTEQGAALSAVSLIASVPATGMYEVTWVASVTTVGDVSSVLGGGTGFQVIYTSPTDSVAKTSNPTTITAGTSAGNTTATTVGNTVVAYCKIGTALQYSFGYTSVNAGVMKYEIHVKAKALGN